MNIIIRREENRRLLILTLANATDATSPQSTDGYAHLSLLRQAGRTCLKGKDDMPVAANSRPEGLTRVRVHEVESMDVLQTETGGCVREQRKDNSRRTAHLLQGFLRWSSWMITDCRPRLRCVPFLAGPCFLSRSGIWLWLRRVCVVQIVMFVCRCLLYACARKRRMMSCRSVTLNSDHLIPR